jgi:hypothetical protein
MMSSPAQAHGEPGNALSISATYSQAEVHPLRDECEELADDVPELSTLMHALRTALIRAAAVAPWRGGGTHAFDASNHMFLMSGAIVLRSAYWNLGFSPEKGDVARDKEAARSMNEQGQTIAGTAHGNSLRMHSARDCPGSHHLSRLIGLYPKTVSAPDTSRQVRLDRTCGGRFRPDTPAGSPLSGPLILAEATRCSASPPPITARSAGEKVACFVTRRR